MQHPVLWRVHDVCVKVHTVQFAFCASVGLAPALFPIWQLALLRSFPPHLQVCLSYELIICSLSFSYPSRFFERRRPLLITTIIPHLVW